MPASRREVARALRYLLENFRHHLREDVAPVVRPLTWLVRHARDG